ncbi:MAG: C39 family peptidase [Oscillospiraceae bacterium]|nr:C39 family peptidase [Oscillospiraceae bacterium]
MCVRKRVLMMLLFGILAACGTGCGSSPAVVSLSAETPVTGTALPVTEAPVTEAAAAVTTVTTTVTVSPQWAEQVSPKGENGHIIENVPHIMQFSEYLTACESVSAVELLRYYGIDMDLDLFVNGFLPVADYPGTGEDGEMHGESPWEYFIGDPNSPDGFGCYSGALVSAINKIKSGLAVMLRYQPLEKLCSDYIDKGQPVIIWATMYMDYPQDSMQWYLPDGRLFTFTIPEHALLLIGYDEYYYYFSDSLQYGDIVGYSKAMTERAYDGLQMQAVAIDPLVLETVPEFWAIKPVTEPAE